MGSVRVVIVRVVVVVYEVPAMDIVDESVSIVVFAITRDFTLQILRLSR